MPYVMLIVFCSFTPLHGPTISLYLAVSLYRIDGYTAAGYSGRMPMAELADAIVQSGRSTLEWTAKYITEHPEWRAEVVYGDTGS